MKTAITVVLAGLLAGCSTSSTVKRIDYPETMTISFNVPAEAEASGGSEGAERELSMGAMGMTTKGGDGARHFFIFVSMQNDDTSQTSEAAVEAAIKAAVSAQGQANLSEQPKPEEPGEGP